MLTITEGNVSPHLIQLLNANTGEYRQIVVAHVIGWHFIPRVDRIARLDINVGFFTHCVNGPAEMIGELEEALADLWRMP